MIKRLEILTNVTILFVAVLAGIVLTRQLRTPVDTSSQSLQTEVGKRFALDGIDWKARRGTLVLAIATTCHYCTDSAAFYRRLVTYLPTKGVGVVAVLPQRKEEGLKYLAGLRVAIEEVRQVSFADLKVRGTPTLILVDSDGVVKNVWVGQLTGDREEQLIEVATNQ